MEVNSDGDTVDILDESTGPAKKRSCCKTLLPPRMLRRRRKMRRMRTKGQARLRNLAGKLCPLSLFLILCVYCSITLSMLCEFFKIQFMQQFTQKFEIAQLLLALERTLILGAMVLLNKKSEAQQVN